MNHILSYGVQIPKTRVRTEQLIRTVASQADDTTTLATQAAKKALNAKIPKAIYLGSESHAYSVKPTSALVAKQLALPSDLFAVDLEFACKAGTAALYAASNHTNYALAIGADIGAAKAGDALEQTVGSAAAAFLLGPESEAIATIDYKTSLTSEAADFWKNHNSQTPSHTGRFTSFTYKNLVTETIQKLLQETNTKIQDYRFVILHTPNLKLPGQIKGINPDQLLNTQIAAQIGNTLSANTLIGLAAALDQSSPKDRILVCSYGSGAGCDAFAITATDNITSYIPVQSVNDAIACT
jgi:hydroxymethylglutaryl-CoA synthase